MTTTRKARGKVPPTEAIPTHEGTEVDGPQPMYYTAEQYLSARPSGAAYMWAAEEERAAEQSSEQTKRKWVRTAQGEKRGLGESPMA